MLYGIRESGSKFNVVNKDTGKVIEKASTEEEVKWRRDYFWDRKDHFLNEKVYKIVNKTVI